MPYIAPEVRADLDDAIEALLPIHSKGELTYMIARLQMKFVAAGQRQDYQRHSDAVAAAADAAHEYRRRVLDPYEDKKAAQHGDIYAIYGGTERI